MKLITEILAQKPVYLNDWENKEGLVEDFEEQGINDLNILFATYGYANYSGDAWVLFEKQGKLYEVNGGHCSCYGLEAQWEPKEVTLKEIEHRLLNGTFGEGYYGDHEFKKELCDYLGIEFVIGDNND